MPANNLPYQLRQNKAIDRNLFVETLSMINRHFLIGDYEYVSMGGPFLEDFKVIHAGTGIKRMISLEIDANTFERQKFNRPINCIKLLLTSSTNFIGSYQFERPSIVWLDFTTPSRLRSDLSDVFELTAKLKRGDVVKVTLNASYSSLPAVDGDSSITLRSRRFAWLEDHLGSYLPSDADDSLVTPDSYPNLLFRIVALVFDRAVGSMGNCYFQPLTSYVYADGQKMLTFTGIILNRDETKEFLRKSGFRSWNLGIIDKDQPIPISTPDLSVKERMFLDSLLPKYSGKTLQNRLRHLVADLDFESLEGIENYVKYYKQFPYFSKVTI